MTTDICNQLKVTLTHSALALAAVIIASSGTARATNIYNFAPGMAGVTGYYPGPDNGQYNAGVEGFTPSVNGSWSGFLDAYGDGRLYFGNNTLFTLTADPGKTVTLMNFSFGQWTSGNFSDFTVLDRNGNTLATVSHVGTGTMADFLWPTLTDTQLTIVFGTTDVDYTWINDITFSEQAILPASITEFGPGATVGELAANSAAIAWTVPYGTDVTTLAPTFTLSSGGCDRTSGGTYDFTSPVTYTVTDGATVNTYTVTVTVAPASSAKDILSFGPYAIISGTNIAWTVPFGSDVTTLAPSYTVSPSASGSPVSETPRNFTSPQTYTITAQNGTTQDYTVTVTVAPDETTVIWDLAGSGAWDSGTPNWEGQISGLPTTFSNGDNVIFDNTSGGTISIASGMLPLSTNVGATSGTYTFSGQPVGSGSLTKSGGGTLRLDVTPENFSSIALNGGTLYLNAAFSFAPDDLPFTVPNLTINSGGILKTERANMQGSLIMNGGTWWDDNGFGGKWTSPVNLASDSFFGLAGAGYSLTIQGEISGPGGFTCNGDNSFLGLFAANSYQGPTIVSTGKLACINPASLGNTSVLNIASGAKVLLGYTGDQGVDSLILGGQTMPAGTYGSSASTAPPANQLDDYFATAGKVFFEDYNGTGTVTVVGTSPYATWSNGEPFENDKNGDGVKNGLAFLLGAANPDENALGRLPAPSKNATGLKLNFSIRKAAARGAAAAIVQWSNDLGAADPWSANVAAVPSSTSVVNGVDFQVDSSGTLDFIEATIPSTEAADGKLFGRLSGEEN